MQQMHSYHGMYGQTVSHSKKKRCKWSPMHTSFAQHIPTKAYQSDRVCMQQLHHQQLLMINQVHVIKLCVAVDPFKYNSSVKTQSFEDTVTITGYKSLQQSYNRVLLHISCYSYMGNLPRHTWLSSLCVQARQLDTMPICQQAGSSYQLLTTYK